MKQFSRMTYDNFATIGEVYEGLPLHKSNLDSFYSLDGDGTDLPLEVKIINNQVASNVSSAILSSNNISAANSIMTFSGNATSYIELNKQVLNSEMFEIEFKFKVQNLNSDMTLLMCKSNASDKSEKELTISIDKNKRMLISEMWNKNGHYSTVPDIDLNGTYSVSDSGAINPGIWYTIRLSKYNDIITVYINDILTKSLICQEVTNFDRVLIGQYCNASNSFSKSFNGSIEYINIFNISDQPVTFSSNALNNDFTIQYDWYADTISQYQIAKLGNSIVSMSQNNILNILYNMNTVIASSPVVEGNVYRICHTYSKTTRQFSTLIYNRTTHKTMHDSSSEIASIGNTNIQIVKNNTVKDLAIYKVILEKKFIIGNCNKRFSMNKDGNIYYDINETDSHKRIRGGTQYHFQLSDDLNSDCETIVSDTAVLHCDGGIKSGSYPGDVVDLTYRYMADAIQNDLTWDKNLHHKAYTMPGWSPGYNGGVENAAQGYHAKWVREGIDVTDICLKMINCNTSNRWMGVNRVITPENLWNRCRVGDNIKVIFKARADIPAQITVGYYRKQFSTNSVGFGESLKPTIINSSSWKTYVHEYTIDEDWDLTQDTSLYFYGNHTLNATTWIQDICIVRNGEASTSEVLLDKVDRKINIPFSKATNLSYAGNWSINYRTKILSSTSNHMSSLGNVTATTGMSWGIENNKFVFKIKNKSAIIKEDVSDITNEWITVSISSTSLKATLTLCTSKGLFTGTISNHNLTATELYNSTYNYDLMLGGINNITSGCAIFKDLSIIKNTTTDALALEQYFRTKISYKDNSIVSSIDIEESFM